MKEKKKKIIIIIIIQVVPTSLLHLSERERESERASEGDSLYQKSRRFRYPLSLYGLGSALTAYSEYSLDVYGKLHKDTVIFLWGLFGTVQPAEVQR